MESKEQISDFLPNQNSTSEPHSKVTLDMLKAKYLHDLPRQLEGIKNTLEIKDYTAIKKQAHRIKGTSGTYRLEGISRGAAQLENFADHQNHEAITTTINKVLYLIELETGKLNPQANSSERNKNG
jgi:HPt (histidine-containing phosphotransfer) domain-containing protein